MTGRLCLLCLSVCGKKSRRNSINRSKRWKDFLPFYKNIWIKKIDIFIKKRTEEELGARLGVSLQGQLTRRLPPRLISFFLVFINLCSPFLFYIFFFFSSSSSSYVLYVSSVSLSVFSCGDRLRGEMDGEQIKTIRKWRGKATPNNRQPWTWSSSLRFFPSEEEIPHGRATSSLLLRELRELRERERDIRLCCSSQTRPSHLIINELAEG